jgi:hypothetical protein
MEEAMTRDLGGLDLKAALRAAREAAMAGGEAALDYWGDTVRYQSKKDGSPVTEGDKASEAAILEVLAEAFPSHSVLTEESGAHEGDARYRWIVDPLGRDAGLHARRFLLGTARRARGRRRDRRGRLRAAGAGQILLGGAGSGLLPDRAIRE